MATAYASLSASDVFRYFVMSEKVHVLPARGCSVMSETVSAALAFV